MKIAIRYFTKSKKGNTEKLAKCIADAVKTDALDVKHDLDDKVDRLFLVNAMYAANIDREVKDFLSRNSNKICEIVNFNTSASGKSTLPLVKEVADSLGIKTSKEEFHCAASWIFINKGLPCDEDFKQAAAFAASMAEV